MTTFPNPTPADIAAVIAAFEPLRAADAPIGEWAGGADAETGVIQMPWFDYSETVFAWERALYEHQIICEYGEPGWMERFGAFCGDPSLLASVDLTVIRKVLTTIVRGERFCEGHVQAMFKAGLVQAAMARLEQLNEG